MEITDWCGNPVSNSVERELSYECSVQGGAATGDVSRQVGGRARNECLERIAEALASDKALREAVDGLLRSSSSRKGMDDRVAYLNARADRFEEQAKSKSSLADSKRKKADDLQEKIDFNGALEKVGDSFSGGADPLSSLNWQINKAANQFNASEKRREIQNLAREAAELDALSEEYRRLAEMVRKQAEATSARAGG